MTEPLLKYEEVAGLLRIHIRRLKSLVRVGALPAVKLGPKTTRFRRQDVSDYIDSRLTVK